jgi:predicted permease
MIEALLQMVVFILCGIAWRRFFYGRLSPAGKREVMTELVYYLFLPALVLDVLWSAHLGKATEGIATVAASSVLVGLIIAWIVYRLAAIHSTTSGALILAAGFPNATYLGLPVLQNTLGDWARAVAIQYDLFACTPLLFTLGIYIARAYGEGKKSKAANHFTELLRAPPLVAAMIGVMLNLGNVIEPSWLHNLLNIMASSVVPLMLLSLGVSLEWSPDQWRNLPLLLPVLIVQLLLMPVWAWFITGFFSFNSTLRIAVILEAAMPSMVFGVVLCDRFQLETPIYAAAVTVSTLLSLVTLPLWYRCLS